MTCLKNINTDACHFHVHLPCAACLIPLAVVHAHSSSWLMALQLPALFVFIPARSYTCDNFTFYVHLLPPHAFCLPPAS